CLMRRNRSRRRTRAMLDPIFSRRHRNPGAWDIPRTPTNEERVQRYRAVAPVTFWNERFARLPASKVLRAGLLSPPTERNADDEFPRITDPRDPDLPAPEGWPAPEKADIRF